jgi:hypothetical protein
LRERKYEKDFIKFGFTSIVINGDEINALSENKTWFCR